MQSISDPNAQFYDALRTASKKTPIITYGILALIWGIFGLSVWLSGPRTGSMLAPNLQILVAIGAMNSSIVTEGHEWYRLLTASLLHGNLLHIALNSFALYSVGRFLEPLIGRGWFLFTFSVGALDGSLAGLAINSAEIVSVGASGAVMGLFSALGILSFRAPKGEFRRALQTDAIQVLIPSLVPLGLSIGGGKIDYAAHLGGALGGVFAIGTLFIFWPKADVLPRPSGLSKTLGLISVVGYGWAIWNVVQRIIY